MTIGFFSQTLAGRLPLTRPTRPACSVMNGVFVTRQSRLTARREWTRPRGVYMQYDIPPGGITGRGMNERTQERVTRAGMVGSVIAAFGASVCCIGPVVAALFGMTSLAALVKYEPLRPVFAIITFGFLGAAFYMTYRKRPAEVCDPDSVCATRGVDRVQRFNRIMLWIAAAIAVIVLTFPAWSGWILG
ncbi:MAG TPA: mercuric transporter MerT family protein [Thermoanaerobaculia bacterium]